MSFFTKNLIHSITYSRQSATPDANGDASFGTQASAVAKVIGNSVAVLGADNNERISTHTVYTETEIKVGDRLWVPYLGDDIANLSHARRVISVKRSPALRGDATLWAIFL